MSEDTADLVELMGSKVGVELLISRDAYLVPTYGPRKDYPAKITYDSHVVRGPNGENITANGIIWMAKESPIPTTARITLPDGTTPPILKSAAPADETGEVLYVRIDFG